MNRTLRTIAAVSLATLLAVSAFAQDNGDWGGSWTPLSPEQGDEITITFDATLNPEIQSNYVAPLYLWWGINVVGGQWTLPPEDLRPEGTVVGDQAGGSVKSPMTAQGNGVFTITLATDERITDIQFVITDSGNHWAHAAPGETNWVISLVPPPPPAPLTWHTFIYDTRSATASYATGSFSEIQLRGTFNGWGADVLPMDGPDELGRYTIDAQVPVGLSEYKFWFNLGQGHEAWVSDPDNPNTDPDDNNNSILIAEADTLPTISHLLPRDGAIFQPGDIIDITGLARTADDSTLLSGLPEITTDPPTTVMDVAMDTNGVFTAWLTAPEILGRFIVQASVSDDSGRIGSAEATVGIFADSTGFHAIDPLGDATGAGSYKTPSGNSGEVDLTSLTVTASDSLDSLRFAVGLAAPSPDTRVMIQLIADLSRQYTTSDVFATELLTPVWDGRGVEIVLANPSSPSFDPEVENRLITGNHPARFGASVTMTSDTSFSVAMSDLVDIMGSFNAPWYINVFSFLETASDTSGHCWEIDSTYGGSNEPYDPDVFDLLFTDSRNLQRVLLHNFTPDRWATLDNEGRGFGVLDPVEVNKSIPTGGPSLRFITRNFETTKASKQIWCTRRNEGATTHLQQSWSGGSTEYITGGSPGDYSQNVTLHAGENRFRSYAVLAPDTIWSPTLRINQIVDAAPHPVVFTTVSGSTVTLHADSSTDPQDQALSFEWTPDPDNPASVSLSSLYVPAPTFEAPSTPGVYYFNVNIEDTDGNISPARTLVTVTPDSAIGFDISQPAPWIRDAVVYEIFPRSYSPQKNLNGITADLDRIGGLGANTIWLMPIFPGPTSHGYEITDYYNIEGDYGTLDDFANLVQQAHARGLRVVLDLVINHTSIQHPFMQDRLSLKEKSNYASWYDTVVNQDNESYSAEGNYTYFYDWLSLPNLNHNDPDVEHYLIEMSKWWITHYDIDGYRCDVAWGVQTRNPDFWVEWRKALKTIKPEVMLLAEADATDFTYLTNRFDMAYDWQLHHNDRNSFVNLFGNSTGTGLNTSVTNHGYYFPKGTFPFRFMENHDEDRYALYHSATQDLSAASLLFTIPGVPLLYAGQEVGETSQRGLINWGGDSHGLEWIYRRLIQARHLFPSLRGDRVTLLDNTDLSNVYSFGRFLTGEAPVVTVLNLTTSARKDTVTLPVDDWNLEDGHTYYLNNLLEGTSQPVQKDQLTKLYESLPASGVKVYAITDTAVTLDAPEQAAQPKRFALHPNYPNPFNPDTQIRFDLPETVPVKLVIYNVLGQRVRSLVDRRMQPGSYTVLFDGRSSDGVPLASGVYFYRLEAGPFVKNRKMVLLK